MFTLAIALAFAFVSCSETDDPGTEEPKTPTEEADETGSGEVDGYALVWQDLFNQSPLNQDNWKIEINGNGNGNAELQYYRAENISIGKEPDSQKSCLIITAKKESYEGRSFTSGRLNTDGKHKFTYGKIEASIKLPKTANGLWPAFWMLGADYATNGWPHCGEIDILEMGHTDGIKGNKTEKYFNGACHWGYYEGAGYPNYAKACTAPYSLQDGKFHLYTLIWDENAIKMYLDLDKNPDVTPYYEMAITDRSTDKSPGNYFHKDCFILFNLAVGGYFTGILNPAQITALPDEEAKMYVDFVKVYQKNK